jgi:hypothetical protein
MDEPRFDDLSRRVGRIATRRGALKLSLCGVLNVRPLLSSPQNVGARCVPLGKKCDKKKDRCCDKGKCKGRCKCGSARKLCDNECILQSDCCHLSEQPCGGGCIPVGECCPDRDRRCADGTCLTIDGCCEDAECNGGVCNRPFCGPAPHQGICTAAVDICAGTNLNCGATPGTCGCVVRPSGLSFCAQGFACVSCTSDAECDAMFAPGAVCVRGPVTTQCGCGPTGTACAIPCPSPA